MKRKFYCVIYTTFDDSNVLRENKQFNVYGIKLKGVNLQSISLFILHKTAFDETINIDK